SSHATPYTPHASASLPHATHPIVNHPVAVVVEAVAHLCGRTAGNQRGAGGEAVVDAALGGETARRAFAEAGDLARAHPDAAAEPLVGKTVVNHAVAIVVGAVAPFGLEGAGDQVGDREPRLRITGDEARAAGAARRRHVVEDGLVGGGDGADADDIGLHRVRHIRVVERLHRGDRSGRGVGGGDLAG